MKCPECKKEIILLIHLATGVREFKATLDDKGKIQYEHVGFRYDDVVHEFHCPECNEVICFEEADAEKFLKSG